MAEEGEAAEFGAAFEELGVEGGHEVGVGEEVGGGAEGASVMGGLVADGEGRGGGNGLRCAGGTVTSGG